MSCSCGHASVGLNLVPGKDACYRRRLLSLWLAPRRSPVPVLRAPARTFSSRTLSLSFASLAASAVPGPGVFLQPGTGAQPKHVV